MTRAVIGLTNLHVRTAVANNPEYHFYVKLSRLSVLHYGGGRGYNLTELVIICRWHEIRMFDDAIDILRPCFSTTRVPEIHWVIEQ
jgi:hypothetical protein